MDIRISAILTLEKQISTFEALHNIIVSGFPISASCARYVPVANTPRRCGAHEQTEKRIKNPHHGKPPLGVLGSQFNFTSLLVVLESNRLIIMQL